MKKTFVSVSLLFAIVLGMVSCGPKSNLPEGVLEEKVMVDFLTDAYLLEGFYAIESNYESETIPQEVRASYEALLKEKGLSEEQFRTSMDYYSTHLDEYEKIHQQVVQRLDEFAEKGEIEL